jgi:single-strand DNA-binding protein
MINRVVLVGRLTRDVEVRKTQSGLSMATFTVACDRRGSRDNQGQQTADFIRCVAWRQTADFLGMYAKKGALVGVDGRIQTGSYERNGQTVYTTDVYADNVRLLESRQQSQSRTQNDSFDSYQPSYNQQPAQPSYNSGNTGNDDFGSDIGFDISSDDLPF